MRAPIRFSVAKDFLPIHTFPHDARAFGSKRFLEAARRYFLSAYGDGAVDVRLGSGGLDVVWTPADAALDPFEYAIALLRRREHPLAIPILQGLLGDHPGDVRILFNLGMAESDLGKIEEAISHLETALRHEPTHAHARVALGVALARAGRRDDAIAALRDAVAQAPNDPHARRNLGALLGQQGHLEDAEAELRAAVRLLPQDQQALYGLGHLLIERGGPAQLDEADDVLGRAIALDPDSDLAERCRTARSRIAATNFRARGAGQPRMDAVMYCLGALQLFATLPVEGIKKITFEIAILGTKGLDVNDPEQKYQLRSLPGKRFSGLHLVSILYVGMKRIDPSADTGFDLAEEYREAQRLAGVVTRPA